MQTTTQDAGPAELRLQDLDVGYRRARPVVGGLSLEIVPGEVLAVVGPNGSGKTTLFRTLLGVLAPLGGQASVSGVGPAEYRRGCGVGYLAEDTAMPSSWTCNGLLTLAAAAAGRGADIERACRLAGGGLRNRCPRGQTLQGDAPPAGAGHGTHAADRAALPG